MRPSTPCPRLVEHPSSGADVRPCVTAGLMYKDDPTIMAWDLMCAPPQPHLMLCALHGHLQPHARHTRPPPRSGSRVCTLNLPPWTPGPDGSAARALPSCLGAQRGACGRNEPRCNCFPTYLTPGHPELLPHGCQPQCTDNVTVRPSRLLCWAQCLPSAAPPRAMSLQPLLPCLNACPPGAQQDACSRQWQSLSLHAVVRPGLMNIPPGRLSAEGCRSEERCPA